ncbi:hypothetical protein ACIOD2_43775 [Amycolatopsis sp. NPDC088138]|uniref:hypothetical protein n=1 Tax=Amycolatopsis sp. NPDC088138 TaxID=3363938 RepID=UPI00382207E6
MLLVAGSVVGCCGAGVATEAPSTLPATGAFVSGRVWFAEPCWEKPGRPSVEVLPGLAPDVLLVPLPGGFVLGAFTLELPPVVGFVPAPFAPGPVLGVLVPELPAVGFVPVAFAPRPALGVLVPELPAVVPPVPGFVMVPGWAAVCGAGLDVPFWSREPVPGASTGVTALEPFGPRPAEVPGFTLGPVPVFWPADVEPVPVPTVPGPWLAGPDPEEPVPDP